MQIEKHASTLRVADQHQQFGAKVRNAQLKERGQLSDEHRVIWRSYYATTCVWRLVDRMLRCEMRTLCTYFICGSKADDSSFVYLFVGNSNWCYYVVYFVITAGARMVNYYGLINRFHVRVYTF